jgi:predicted DNA-binding transcriptional regulator
MLEIPAQIKDALRSIGLDRTETQIYVLLLKKNLLSVAEITKELKLPRSSVHLACENLLKNGVVKVTVTGKRRSFYIDNPKAAENYIVNKQNELESQRLSFQSALPGLTALFAIAQESEPIDIEELQGEDGFVDIFYRSLNQDKGGEILRFGGDPALFTVGRDRLKKYRESRMKKKIYTRILMPRSDLAKLEIEDAKFKMREVKILEKEIYNPKINASIWKDTVAITIWDKGLHSIIIRNKAIYEFMKQMFEILWKTASDE